MEEYQKLWENEVEKKETELIKAVSRIIYLFRIILYRNLIYTGKGSRANE